MHLRINEVTVSPSRIDELGDVLSNKALPVVREQAGSQGLLCAANRETGVCNIVSFWDTKQSLEASEKAIASIRSETVDAVDAKLKSISIDEVVREVRVRPSQVGSRARVVRLAAPAGSSAKMLEFYDSEAAPLLQSQPGFLNSRLIRDTAEDGRFAAVSHWADAASAESSEQNSVALREQVSKAVAGTSVESAAVYEIILIELTT